MTRSLRAFQNKPSLNDSAAWSSGWNSGMFPFVFPILLPLCQSSTFSAGQGAVPSASQSFLDHQPNLVCVKALFTSLATRKCCPPLIKI